MARILAFCVCLCFVLGSALVRAHGPDSHRHVEAPVDLDEVRIYLARYRQSGDDGWLESVARYFHETPARSPEARLLRAWHAQAQHRFRAALGFLDPTLIADHPEVGLLAANLSRVLGERERAHGYCGQVFSRDPVLGKFCRLRSALHWQVEPVRETLVVLGVIASRSAPAKPAARAWMFATLADGYAALGDAEEALIWSSRALGTERTVFHQAQQARLLLAMGDYTAVLATVGVRPTAPALELLRLQAHLALNRGDRVASDIARLEDRFRRLVERHDFGHGREMATFFLDVARDVEFARLIARENWRRQREPEDRVLLERTRSL